MIACPEGRDGCTHLLNDADTLMAQNSARLTTGEVAFKDMKVGATDGCLGYPDDSVCRRRDSRLWPIFKDFFALSHIDKSFHH